MQLLIGFESRFDPRFPFPHFKKYFRINLGLITLTLRIAFKMAERLEVFSAMENVDCDVVQRFGRIS